MSLSFPDIAELAFIVGLPWGLPHNFDTILTLGKTRRH
jgi:hypothetical protein